MTIKSSNRTVVNVIGVPTILALIWSGGPLFGVFISIVILLASREFLIITEVNNQGFLKMLTYIGGIGFCYYYYYLPDLNAMHILLFSTLFVMIAFLTEIFYTTSNPTRNL